jgi:ComF family protein
MSQKWLQDVQDLVFGVRCAGCDRPGAPLCPVCRCALAAPPPHHRLPGVVVALPFTERVRDVVLGLKYRNRRAVAGHLARLLARRLDEGGGCTADVVTWVPTTPERRRRRGFDQAELLARALARELGLPTRRLLDRRPGAPQTGGDRAARLIGPRLRARPSARGARVLLVDDVVTTGATLSAARQALAVGGARHVGCVALAATPGRTPAGVAAPLDPAPRRVA